MHIYTDSYWYLLHDCFICKLFESIQSSALLSLLLHYGKFLSATSQVQISKECQKSHPVLYQHTHTVAPHILNYLLAAQRTLKIYMAIILGISHRDK